MLAIAVMRERRWTGWKVNGISLFTGCVCVLDADSNDSVPVSTVMAGAGIRIFILRSVCFSVSVRTAGLSRKKTQSGRW